ncbi:MAG: hypothetical protein KF872_05040 [Chitinophagales bacterium]|nr:hypothetical protein [Chitinophagales bacterium]
MQQSLKVFLQPYFAGCMFLGIWLSSCATLKDRELQSQLNKSNCNQQNSYSYSKADIPRPIHELPLDTLLTSKFSFNSLNAANAIGILDLLTAYIKKKEELKANYTIENRLDLLETYQEINQQVDFASLEISAASSEIDCEEERADQISSYLKNIESTTETRLTVGSIVVGAAGGVTSGILAIKGNEGNVAEYIGLGTGLAETALGLGILLNERKVIFHHKRNVLKGIWNNAETSDVLPASIWYYLNYFNPQKPDKPSLRDQIMESWMSFKQIKTSKEEKRKVLIDIYFGNGGKYTAAQLKNRARMYDQLESVIKLMKQDLKELMLEIGKIRQAK